MVMVVGEVAVVEVAMVAKGEMVVKGGDGG